MKHKVSTLYGVKIVDDWFLNHKDDTHLSKAIEKRCNEIYDYLKANVTDGHYPTCQEISDALDIDKSVVYEDIVRLEKLGRVTRRYIGDKQIRIEE